MTENVTIVAAVGAGANEYKVLERGEETRTSGGIEHYDHVATVAEDEVDEKISDLEERYGTVLTEKDA